MPAGGRSLIWELVSRERTQSQQAVRPGGDGQVKVGARTGKKHTRAAPYAYRAASSRLRLACSSICMDDGSLFICMDACRPDSKLAKGGREMIVRGCVRSFFRIFHEGGSCNRIYPITVSCLFPAFFVRPLFACFGSFSLSLILSLKVLIWWNYRATGCVLIMTVLYLNLHACNEYMAFSRPSLSIIIIGKWGKC